MPQDYDSKVNFHLDINHGLDRVTELVQTRLIECGWRDQVKLACRKTILESGDKHIPTVDLIDSPSNPKSKVYGSRLCKKGNCYMN
ncbi:hypothetical protein NQ317_015038 [Molorchus minor]|uniref:Enhancer of yellow 2 transcription factor n=1 Tax=Molorchus minor TaxID=1323400 RepID=A0ABQ9K5T2_9CUCU|nr:hypothetical protein NQ317_015038 [Molorchus minor]